MLEDLGPQAFEPLVGDVFTLTVPERPELELVLAEVERGGPQAVESARDAGLREPFSIVLHGPAEPLLPQGVHRLEHETLGALELFLVPIALDGRGAVYEAVFG